MKTCNDCGGTNLELIDDVNMLCLDCLDEFQKIKPMCLDGEPHQWESCLELTDDGFRNYYVVNIKCVRGCSENMTDEDFFDYVNSLELNQQDNEKE